LAGEYGYTIHAVAGGSQFTMFSWVGREVIDLEIPEFFGSLRETAGYFPAVLHIHSEIRPTGIIISIAALYLPTY